MNLDKTYNIIMHKGLKANYNITDDIISIKFIASRLSEEDETHSNQTFKQLTLITDMFGEPDSLMIKAFKTDGWHKNKDLLKYVIISHFDESETEADIFVQKILKTPK